MRIKIALALTSAIFMMMWIAYLANFINFSMFTLTTSSLLFIGLIEFLSIISFFGSILFLLEARKVLPRWYLAVPLSISLLILLIVNFWIYFSGKELLSDHIGLAETLSITFLALLPLFSVLVFLSLHRHPDSMNVYLAVSCTVSLLSIIFLYFTLRGLSYALSRGWPTFDAVALQLYYWFFVMPIIGICFLVRSITYKNPENTLSSATVGSTQN